jgi:F-type H+-transporting ATPase subunit gamma
MADRKEIRKRISSVQNTRQITRAMKMVAAAKLRRAQDAILSTRPFAYRIYSILLSLFQREGIQHPLLVSREEKKIRLIIVAGDRGLCGSFNANVFKEAQRFIKTKEAAGIEVSLDVIGKKAHDFFKKKYTISSYHEGLLSKVTYSKASAIAHEILEAYLKEEFDAIYLVYNEFKSAIQQRVTVERLIPVATEVPEGVVGILKVGEDERFKNYIFEPSKEEILNDIVPKHFYMQFFRCVLESVASEHGARMSAMENASKNASEMIEDLTLLYNKARQAAITKELMEIVGGVEAMK